MKNNISDSSLHQVLQQGQKLKMSPRIMMSPHMQQAIRFMQIPIMSLAAEIEEQMTLNPLLEYSEDPLCTNEQDTLEPEISPEKELVIDEHDFAILKNLDEDFQDHFAESGNFVTRNSSDDEKKKTFLDSLIQSTPSLYQLLMIQAQETFQEPEKIAISQAIIGNLTEYGFFETPIQEICLIHNFKEDDVKEVLDVIKTFDPPGVGASSIQESLLIQLRYQNKENTFAYLLIESCYDDLIHNRIPAIEKKLKCSADEIRHAIDKEIDRLDIHPGTQFSPHEIQTVRPDVSLRQEDDKLIVETNRDDIPALRLNTKYLRMLQDENTPQETKNYIQHHVLSAKWLMRTLQQRQSTIERIAAYLVENQSEFLTNPEGKLVPLTMKVVAEALELHESTIARAVANKYINTPRGLLPLRDFFTNAYLNPQGEDISSTTVREAIEKMIEEENKKHPLSDQSISNKLNKDGIPCARRTVAKYRTELNLGAALQRKQFE